MSPKECSLALDEDVVQNQDEDYEPKLDLLINSRFNIQADSSTNETATDTVRVGGRMTISF